MELLRERVYASLEAYCKQKYPEAQGRYAIVSLQHIRGLTLCYEVFYCF